MNLREDWQFRGLIHQVTDDGVLDRLSAGGVTAYIGFDPTASSSGATALRGSILAFVYCLGLGLPFVVAAIATEWMATASNWLRRHHRLIGRIGGVMLILIGLAEISGAWHTFVLWLQVHFPATNAIL